MNNFCKISEAIKYIDAHLNDTLSVGAIAEQFAFSPYYFHRLFTSVVGKSMIAYVRDRRIAFACKMLSETNRKVLDIALDFGFDSAQGFPEPLNRLRECPQQSTAAERLCLALFQQQNL